MRGTLAWILLCALLVALFAAPMPAAATALQAASLVTQSTAVDGMIRVSLSSIKSTTFNLTVSGSYTIGSASVPSGSLVRVEMSGGTIYVTMNGTRTAMGTSVTLARQSGGIRIAESLSPNSTYPGNLTFLYTGGVAYAVCTLYIEDYVSGVLPFEMDNSFPLEALKSQAIAARTYAIRNKKIGGVYDVTDTINHQVFRGVDYSKANCIQATNDTKGIVMKYGGTYIDANFGASNGGQTELNSNAWSSGRVGYLHMKDDPYDLANPRSIAKSHYIYATPYAGNSSTAYGMIRDALAQRYGGVSSSYNIESIVDVALHTPKYASPSRVYTQLRVTVRYNGNLQNIVDIPVFPTVKKTLGLSINSVDNELLTVTREANGFRITARRYGHGVGMSQRGAEQMANTGFNYQYILGFYFTGIELVQVNFTSNWAVSNPGTAWPTQAPSGSITGETPGRVAVANTNDRLNMRATPTLNGSVVSRLSHGAQVTVIGEVGTWYQIRYGTLTGYVAREFIVLQPVVMPTPTPLPTQQPTSGEAYVKLQSGRLNLRSEARATSSIVTSIPNGAAVTVLNQGTVWSQIRYANMTGYVMTQYLSISQSGQNTQATATVRLSDPNGTLNLRVNPSTNSAILLQLRHAAVVNVVEKGTTWSKVSLLDVSGYVMNSYLVFSTGTNVTPTAAPTQKPAQTWKGTVTLSSGKLNMRSQPNNNAPVVAEIPNHAQVTVTALGDSWCAVTYGTTVGYVTRRYLTIGDATPASPTPAPTAVSTSAWVLTPGGGGVNLRRSPSSAGSIETTIPYGAEVRVIDSDASWSYVQYGSSSGYVSTQYLTRTNPGGSSTGTTPGGSNPGGNTTPGVTYAYIKTESGGPVNLRQQASGSSNIVTQLAYGTRVQVLADGAEWIQVRTDSHTGYVSGDYLSMTQPAGSANPSTPQTGLSGLVNRGKVNAGTGSALLRSQPTAQAEVTSTLANQAALEIIRYEGNMAQWLYVRSGGITGYMLRTDAAMTYSIAAVAVPGTGTIATLFASASTAADMVAVVEHGTVLTIMQNLGNGWAQVRTANGITAYIELSMLVYL